MKGIDSIPHKFDFFLPYRYPLPNWRGGRVAEGARLESVYTETYRGFESLSLRQIFKYPSILNKKWLCAFFNKTV